jgi:PAS domain S-box-containing protein
MTAAQGPSQERLDGLARDPPPQGSWLAAMLGLPGAIPFSLGGDGRIQWVGPQAKEILGLDPDRLVGRDAIAGLMPAQQAEARGHQQAKAGGREDRASYETALRTPDGQEVWLHIASHAVRDDAGRLVAVHGIALDVTTRKRAEQALERSHERYADLVENANDILYLHDLEGRFVSVNATAQRTYGYTQDEFLRLSIRDIVDPAHLSRAAEQMRLKVEGQTKRSAPYELLTRAKDGRPVWVEVSTRVVEGPAGRPGLIQGIARDTTARHEAEAALRLIQRLALATSRAPDLPSALRLALDGVVEATGSARAEAWVPRADGRLELAAAVPAGRSNQAEKFHRLSGKATFAVTEGLSGRALREGGPVWVPDLAHEPAFLRAASAGAAGYRSLLAVPVVADGGLVTLLIVFLGEPRQEPPGWVPLVESVAGQLASLLALRQSEDRLRSQLDVLQAQWDLSPVAVLLIDAEGQVLGANRKFLALCDVTLTEPMAGPEVGFVARVSDPARFQAAARTLYEGRAAGADEVVFQGRILRRFTVALGGEDAAPSGQAVYLRDITDVRALEKQLAGLKQVRLA